MTLSRDESQQVTSYGTPGTDRAQYPKGIEPDVSVSDHEPSPTPVYGYRRALHPAGTYFLKVNVLKRRGDDLLDKGLFDNGPRSTQLFPYPKSPNAVIANIAQAGNPHG